MLLAEAMAVSFACLAFVMALSRVVLDELIALSRVARAEAVALSRVLLAEAMAVLRAWTAVSTQADIAEPWAEEALLVAVSAKAGAATNSKLELARATPMILLNIVFIVCID